MSEVTLVGCTEPRIPGMKTVEELVAYTARVSNPSNQANTDTAPKLLRYLMKNQHWSPFEMVSMTMEINTTRDIARQVLRHRSFAFQEFSQRYADPTVEFADTFVFREARFQDTKNRQNSIELDDANEAERLLGIEWQRAQGRVKFAVEKEYNWAIKNGIAKEQARAVLPEGNTKSRLYMAGSLRSWLHYCLLRTEAGTQKEHRVVAEQCFDIVKLEFPSIAELYNNKD